MKVIPVNEFETNCHFFLEQVEKSGEPLMLLKNGLPFTRVLPCKTKKKSLFGIYQGQIEIYGDIIEPIDVEWDAMK